MSVRALITFFGLTFGLTWGLAAVFVLFTDFVLSIFGELDMTNPLFFLAVYSPGIAALLLVARYWAASEIIGFLSRILMWRCSAGWYLLILIGVPASMYVGAAANGNLEQGWIVTESWAVALPALAIALFLGPIEELGWRGFALPLLQKLMPPLLAGLLLGAIWALWHIPAFLLSGTPQSAWSFGPYFFSVVSISVIMTAMFNASRGSLLLPILFHFQLNNPLWPDAQPYDAFVTIPAAIAVAFYCRDTRLSSESAVTEVVPNSHPH